jgi:pSer/pThr/pTyr-binding forkhead associated (FHA) protein
MLKLHFKDNQRPPVWIVEKLFSIGRAEDNHLVIDDEGIDPLHARVIQEHTKYYLKDQNSNSGCFVNGQRVTQKEILPGDIIKLGHTEIIVLDPRSLPDKTKDKDAQIAPWRLVSDGSWLAGKHFILPPGRNMVIGRGNQCDIVIPGTHLSRRHTEISIEGNHLRIKDLGSANGTFLNELRVDNATANNGDRLRLDVYTFRIVAPDIEDNKTRIRKPIDELNKPVERKLPSNEPKRWKTRPTSPGNRIEPDLQQQKRRKAWLALIAATVAVAAIAVILLW